MNQPLGMCYPRAQRNVHIRSFQKQNEGGASGHDIVLDTGRVHVQSHLFATRPSRGRRWSMQSKEIVHLNDLRDTGAYPRVVPVATTTS